METTHLDQLVHSAAQHRERAVHHTAFEAWYAEDGSFRRTSQKIAVPERTLYDWAQWFAWRERARNRDLEVRRVAEQNAVRERAERLEEQRRAGTLLRERATDYLISYKILNTRDAIHAIRVGIEIERQCDQLPDIYLKIINANTNEELDAIEAAIESEIKTRED